MGLNLAHRFYSSVVKKSAFYAAAFLFLLQFGGQNCFAAPCGDSLKILMHYHGTQLNSHAGVKIGAIGDVNGDEFSDVAIAQLGDTPGTNLLLGGNPSDSISSQLLKGLFEGAIDLDGDGVTDVVTSLVRSQQSGPPGVLYFFKGFPDSLAGQPFDSLIVPAVEGFGIGVPASVGNGDGDLLGDLLVLDENRSGGPALRLHFDCPAVDTSTDWEFDIAGYSHDIRGFGFIDFDGDGYQDIYFGMHADIDTISYVYIFYGPQFGQNPNLIMKRPIDLIGLNHEEFAQFVNNIGDVNGDGWSDLGIVYDFQSLVYFSGPSGNGRGDFTYDIYLTGRSHVMARAGDINGDGFDDIVTGQTRTFDGAVDVYLGGPDIDAAYDCSIYSDDLPPVLIQDIGYKVSAAGDFNNDGFEDFMFSCRNFVGGVPGDVFVIAGGPGFVANVPTENQPFPNSSTLSQNYPNPFNPSTTIEFELATPARAVVRVYNALGEVVRTLVDRQMSVGLHRVVWDGKDERGNEAASGVYLYRLTAGEVVQEKKMVLVR